MEENKGAVNSDREREKCGLYHKSKSTQVFDGGQMFQKFHDNREQTEPINTTTSSSLSPFSLTSTDEQIDFSQQDDNDVLMVGGVGAQRKRLNSSSQSKIQLKKYNEFLINKIKELEDRISNRDMMVNALKRELDYFRDISVVDAEPLTSTSFSHDSGDSSRIQMMVTPLSKNEELLYIKLKQRENEISLMKQELKTRATSIESEQMSNKILVLESQIKEQTETIDELNLEVVQKTKMLDRVQDQLQKKSEDFGKHNMKTTLEIKRLMKNVEELGRELRNRDNELKQARDELSSVRHDLECNFGCQLASLKEQLKLCHDEERGRLNVIYDDLQVQYNRAHETEVACYKKQIEALSNRVKEHRQSEQELETELEACRLAHDAQINSYKECVGNLMEELSAEKEKHEIEFKRQIERYKSELERYKYELDSCMRQLKNGDNKIDEEKKKIEEACAEKIQEIHSKYEAQFVIYKCCTESLRKKEQLACEEASLLETQYQENISELKKEVEKSKQEINDANLKLLQSQNNEKDLVKKLEECKTELNKNAEICHSLKDKLQAKESSEEKLLSELKNSQELIDEFKIQIEEYEKLPEDIASMEAKHENEIISFQNQIGHLMSTIADVESKHKEELNQLVEQIMILQQQIETLQDLADCDNLDAVCDKLKDYKVCNEEIKSLRSQLNVASNSVLEYENRLSELHKCYDTEISLYKNQIDKLQEELNNASCLEENLIRQLNNQMTGMKESKECIRDLLMKKDIQVYFVEKDGSCNNCSDGSSSSKEISDIKFQNDSENSASQGEISDEMKLLCSQLEQLTAQNQTLKQELNDLKKSNCNTNKIQLRTSEQQKKHIEHALLKELEKELHDCKLDNNSKTHDIEELINANNDLADHYNNAEIQLNNLKEFATQKVAEIGSLKNENERLIEERTQLESNQMLLLAKLESLSQNSQEMTSLPNDMFLNQGCHIDVPIKKFFRNVATSTPDLVDNKIYDDVEDGLTPRRKTDYKYRTNQILSRWMNNCNELEIENTKLKKEIELLKLQLKEMECCSDAIKSQMSSFEENCESLKSRIIELESKKKLIRELELMNEQLKLRNEKLEEDRLILRSDIANLKEENINIEKKYDETLAQLLAHSGNENFDSSEAFESLVFELNKKSEEVLILKEELSLKQETITSLEDELHKLLEIRREMTLKFDNLLQDLKGAEEELLNLRQERLNVGLEKRLSEKKLLVLKAHNEQLLKYFSDKVQKNCNNEVISIVEELEKELVELHKNLSAERGVIERMSVERTPSKNSGNSCDGSETSFKIELLMNTFEQLQSEKETLKSKTVELQEIIDKYNDGNEVDESWKLEVKESQKKLLIELEGYGKQHFDLGKTLMETEELKAKAELAEKELMMKVEEKLKVENLLAEERQGLKNALNRINYLETQLCEKMNVLQVLNEEKEDLQGNLMALQEKLCSLEEHLEQQKLILEGEIQERELRVRHAHLELHAAQLDKNVIINKMILDAKAVSEMERVSHLRDELEKEHDMAICRLKRLYTSQLHEVLEGAAAQEEALEQNHQEQVMMPYVLTTPVNDDSSNMEYE